MKVPALGLSKDSREQGFPVGMCHPCSEVCVCVCCLPSVWTQEATCHLLEANVKDHEELGGKKVPRYPCLWVNVSVVGQWAMLYHTEDTKDQNQQVMNGDWVLALTDL